MVYLAKLCKDFQHPEIKERKKSRFSVEQNMNSNILKLNIKGLCFWLKNNVANVNRMKNKLF